MIVSVLRIQLKNRDGNSWTWKEDKGPHLIVSDQSDQIRVPLRVVRDAHDGILNLNPDCDVEARDSVLHISFRNVKLLPGEDSLDDSGKLVVHIPLSEVLGFGIEFRPVG